ncbi:MAG TPA: sigma-70 family RNA polymerase sigma factor [Polyangiaceae bacterium]|nr:sigma-70 family RNA polymerase sigma factor [Polyangiaceae bacterium]
MRAAQALYAVVREIRCLATSGVAPRYANVHAAATLSWVSYIFAVVLLGARDEDEKLLRRIAAGDPRALETFYGQVSGRCMAVALRLLKDRGEAEDVVQETFLDVWKRARQFEPGRGGAAAWVITMTRNRAIDRLRAKGTSARAAEGARAEPIDDTAPAPLELTEQRRDRERVLAALGALPAEQRRVIELAYFEGLTQSEIAQNIDEPLGTIKTRVRLAMAKLADLLGAGREGAA